MLLKNSTIRYITQVILLKIILDFVYVYFVADLYGYAGIVYKVNVYKYIASFFLSCSLIIPIAIQRDKPSGLFCFLLYVFIFLPMQTMWAFGDAKWEFLVLVSLGLLNICILSNGRNYKVKYLSNGKILIYIISVIVIAAYFFALIKYGGYKYISFDLENMYENRKGLYENVLTGFWGYAPDWVGKVIIPAAIGFFLYRKNFYIVLIILLLSVANFGILHRKEMLFYGFVIVFFYIMHSRKINIHFSFLTGLFGITILSVVLYLLTSNNYIIGLMFHRMFFVIAQNHYEYYLFFQEHDFVYLSNSIFSSIVDYPFKLPVPYYIGENRFGVGRDSFSNAGVFASGYMQFGAFGVLFYSIIVGLVFRLYNSFYYHGLPEYVVLGLGFSGAFQLVNGDLPTVLLTHGLGLGLLLMYFFVSDIRNNADKRSF